MVVMGIDPGSQITGMSPTPGVAIIQSLSGPMMIRLTGMASEQSIEPTDITRPSIALSTWACRMAMTGELTLRGRVLPVGGVKEKVLAARRAGVREVIMPRKNQANLEDLPDYVRESMTIHFISDVGEAIRLALVSEPESCYTSSLMEQPILPLFPQQRQEMVLKASPAQHGAGRGESD